MRSQGKPLCPRLEKQVNAKNHSVLEPKPRSRGQDQGKKVQAGVSSAGGSRGTCLSTKSPGPALTGDPRFWEFYLQEPYQVLTVKIQQKHPCFSSRWRGKLTVKKFVQSILFFSTRFCSREIILPEPNQLGLCEIPTDLGEGKCSTPAPAGFRTPN